MVYYDTDNRLQFTREHEMRRARRLTQDEAGLKRRTRPGSAFAARFDRVYGRWGHTPAYQA